MLYFKYFLFFFVNIARSYVSPAIVSAVGISNLLQVIFLQGVRVLFIAIGIYLSSSTGFLVVSLILAYEALQGCWNVLLNPLKTRADLHLYGSMGLTKCRDVSVGLDSFFAFSNGDYSYIVNSLFSKSWCYLFFWSQCQLPIPDNSIGNAEFFMRVGSGFCRIKSFLFYYVFCLPLAVHLDLQVSVPGFLECFRGSSSRNNFFGEKRREFILTDLF